MKNSKDELEKKLNFELLCLLREMAMKKIQRENSGEVCKLFLTIFII